MPAGPPKLKCFKKNLKKKNKNCWKFFQVRRTHSQAVGSSGLVTGLPNLKCLKEVLIKENRKEKKTIISFLFLEILFQLRQACSQAVDADGFTVGLTKLENIKSFSK
jgi:hypothetical protein